MHRIYYPGIIALAVAAVLVSAFLVVTNGKGIQAFDVTPTVDANPRTLLSGTPQIYKFGAPVVKNVTYSDGSVVPSVTMSIERYNQTSQSWEVIGYTNTHLHKLKVDETDKVDISLGHTDRVNVKQTGAAPDTTGAGPD